MVENDKISFKLTNDYHLDHSLQQSSILWMKAKRTIAWVTCARTPLINGASTHVCRSTSECNRPMLHIPQGRIPQVAFGITKRSKIWMLLHNRGSDVERTCWRGWWQGRWEWCEWGEEEEGRTAGRDISFQRSWDDSTTFLELPEPFPQAIAPGAVEMYSVDGWYTYIYMYTQFGQMYYHNNCSTRWQGELCVLSQTSSTTCTQHIPC